MPRKQSDVSESAVSSKGTASTTRKTSSPSGAARHRKSPVAASEPQNGTNGEVAREDIARLAYALWESRGYQGGSPEEDWLQAEQELLKSVSVS